MDKYLYLYFVHAFMYVCISYIHARANANIYVCLERVKEDRGRWNES